MAEDYPGPIPKPTPETQPYWDAAKRHVLMIQRCDGCGEHYFYPRPLCPRCFSRDVRWVQVSGKGRLHTYTINYRPPRKFPTQSPVIIAVIELDEGPRLMSNIVGSDADPAKLRCDAPVEVVFEDITAEITLPKFRMV